MSSDDPIDVMTGKFLEDELKRRAEARKLMEEAIRAGAAMTRPAVRKAPRPKRARPDEQIAKAHKPTNREKRRQRRQAKHR